MDASFHITEFTSSSTSALSWFMMRKAGQGPGEPSNKQRHNRVATRDIHLIKAVQIRGRIFILYTSYFQGDPYATRKTIRDDEWFGRASQASTNGDEATAA